MPKYLMHKNIPAITIFLVWSIALFLVFFNGPSEFWASMQEKVNEIQAKDSLFCFLTPLAIGVACGLLPASWKASLVFWRFRHALPGCRAYSKLAKKDDRIHDVALNTHLGSIPSSPREENATWYQWYKTVQEHVTVKEAHQRFLLYRDLAGMAFLFFVFGTIALLLSSVSSGITMAYAIIVFAEYLIFAVVARNHGNRFVCNVVVEYLNKI